MTTAQAPQPGHWLAANTAGQRVPLSGQWELTCRCNLRCVMCYTDCFNTADRLRQELTLPEIIRIMDEIQEAGCLELTLTGGEPLMRNDFLDVYTAAKQKGFVISVFTNGTLLTERLVEWWTKYPPAMIEISLHGFGEHSFEQITRGRGSYARCMAGIHLILARRLPLTLKTTGMTVNRDEILKIKEYVSRLGERYGTKVGYRFGSDIRARLDGSDDVFSYQLADEEIIAIEQADPEFRAERSRQDDRRQTMVRQGQGLCVGGQRKFHIDAYGQLQLCSNNRRESYDLRRGSFREGFYDVLPHFPCPARRPPAPETVLSIATLRHAPSRGVA